MDRRVYLFTVISFIVGMVELIIGGILNLIAADWPVSLRKQLATLKSNKILFAHLTTFLFLAGHFTFYAYFTPFIHSELGLTGSIVSVIYFVFGVAAVIGGGFGGILTDRFGSKRVVLLVTALFAISLFV